MDNFGDFWYIIFFAFLLIVNAIAGANKRKKKQEQQRRQREQQPGPEPGERTKSLEEVMRELFGEPERKAEPPKAPPPQPKPLTTRTRQVETPSAEAPTRKRVTSEEIESREIRDIESKFVNPLQEVMMRSMTSAETAAKRQADKAELERIFAHRPAAELRARHYRVDLRQAIIHHEILKPKWLQY